MEQSGGFIVTAKYCYVQPHSVPLSIKLNSVEAPSGERLRRKRQAWCLLQVKLCDPCLSTLKWFVYHAKRYTSARLYL